ncbi:hypothetical protein [Nonomuraea sp. NPDC049750]|uniref:hypothetical protein n=1 Tax=Nonomuraea sp. NPDC049750 TaxID=3154738 RepID=UPI0033DB283C
MHPRPRPLPAALSGPLRCPRPLRWRGRGVYQAERGGPVQAPARRVGGVVAVAELGAQPRGQGATSGLNASGAPRNCPVAAGSPTASARCARPIITSARNCGAIAEAYSSVAADRSYSRAAVARSPSSHARSPSPQWANAALRGEWSRCGCSVISRSWARACSTCPLRMPMVACHT